MGGVYRPLARREGLVVEPIADELLVFDGERGRAHSLNPTAAAVWRACDGQRSLGEIAAHCGADRATVALALARLNAAHLVARDEGPGGISRRLMLRRGLAASAALGAAVPVIRSITAPTPAMAASTHRNGRNGGKCRTAASCSHGSVCRPSGSHFNVCYRPAGASCYYVALSPSSGSVCSSHGYCPSTQTCP